MSDHTLIALAWGYILGREAIDVLRVVLRWRKVRRQGAAPRAFTGLH